MFTVKDIQKEVETKKRFDQWKKLLRRSASEICYESCEPLWYCRVIEDIHEKILGGYATVLHVPRFENLKEHKTYLTEKGFRVEEVLEPDRLTKDSRERTVIIHGYRGLRISWD